MKKILFAGVAASCLLVATSAQAQVSFGPRVGLNASTLSYDFDNGPAPSSTYRFGAQAGFSVNAQFGKVSVQPSLLFAMKGNDNKLSDTEIFSAGGQTVTTTYERNQSLSLSYIELPVNLVYSTNGAEGGFQVFAGPYVAIGINGKAKSDYKETSTVGGITQSESGSDNVDIKFASKESKTSKAYLCQFDAGFNMGVGYKIGGIQAQLGYGLGLGNLIPNDADDQKPTDKVHNRGFQLSLAYFFQSH